MVWGSGTCGLRRRRSSSFSSSQRVFFFLFVLLFLGCFVLVMDGRTPGVRWAEWQEKRTFILGEQWNVAEYQVRFFETPHVLESVACPRLPCPQPDTDPPLCDYSKTFEDCGEGPVGCNPEQKFLACLGSGTKDDEGEVIREPEWVMLEDGVVHFVDDHPRNTFRNYRFYIPPVSQEEEDSDSCRAMVLDIAPFTGDPDTFIHNEPPAATISRNTYRQDNIFGGEIVVCPSDPAFQRGMTVYIGVYTFVLPAVYNLVASMAVLPPYVPVANCTEDLLPCLTDGVPRETIFANTNFLYQPQVTGPGRDWKGEPTDCPVVHIGLTAQDKQVSLRVLERDRTTKETISLMTTVGNGFVAKDFSLCGRDGELLADQREYLVAGLVVSVLPEEVVPFEFLASTFVSAEVTALVDLPPFTAMGRISEVGQDIRLNCPEFESSIFGGEFISTRFVSQGLVYGGVTGNAYNPLPTLSEKLLRDSFSTNPSWAREYFSQPQTLYVYFVFRFTLGNVPQIVNVSNPGTCSIDFSPALVTRNRRRVVEDTIEFVSLPVMCNEEDFTIISDQIRAELLDFSPIDPQNVTLEEAFESVSYLDVLRYNNSWMNCERQMYQYFVVSDPIIPVVLTRDNYCEALLDRWVDDACCNGTACCDPADYSTNVQAEVLDNLQVEFAQDTCAEYNCTSLFLRDFSSERSFQSLGFCGNRVSDGSLRVFYVRCKDSLYDSPRKEGKLCSSDEDCIFEFPCQDGACRGLGRACRTDEDCVIDSRCDFFSGVCTGDFVGWEEMFLGCFILNMTVSVGDQIANIYDIPPLSTSYTGSDYLDYFSSLREIFSERDCVSLTGVGMDGLVFRNHSEVTTASTPGSSSAECRCTQAINRTYEYCLDRDCLLPRECLFGVYLPCLFLSRNIRASQGLCVNGTICNWNTCSGLDPLTCANICNSSPNGDQFCGICDRLQCIEVATRQTEGDCLAEEVCESALGSYISAGVEGDGECEREGGKCSVQCGGEAEVQCASRTSAGSVCYSDGGTLAECHASPLGGVWIEEVDVCVYRFVNNSRECLRNGLNFESCLDLDEIECRDCAHNSTGCPIRQDLLNCFLSPRFPCSFNQCQAQDGGCDDDVFINTQVTPFIYGACVLPFGENSAYRASRFFCSIPRIVTQLGCIDYSIPTPESCSLTGGTWITPASTASECVAHGAGCQTDQSSVTGLLENLTPVECLACGGIYRDYFEWTEARWVEGRRREPEWRNRDLVRSNLLLDSLSFPTMESVVRASVEVDQILNLEADALCITSKEVIDSLDVMSCACAPMSFSGAWLNLTGFTNVSKEESESFTGACADDNNVEERTYGAVRSNVCPAEREFLLQASVLLECSDNCLQTIFFCVELSMLPVSANEYLVPTQNTISLSFVEAPTLTNEWSVVENEKGAEVGQLIGDGAEINVTTGGQTTFSYAEEQQVDGPPIVLTQLCFEIRPDIEVSPSFTVYDAGIVDKDGVIRPLYLNFTFNEVLFEGICGAGVDLEFGTSKLFPIKRYDNALIRDAPGLNSGEKAIIYLSASFYTIALLSTIFQFSVPFWKTHRLYMNYIACVHVFFLYLIRSVYLFLLGSEVLPENQEDIADYILIELPIFFYLGTFSLIGMSFLLWWLRARRGFEISAKMFWVGFGVWSLVIWLYFAIVIILISVLTEDDGEIVRFCGNRLAKEEGENDARTIRIIYTSIILALTLVIVFLNVYVGLDLAKESQSNTVYQSVWMSFGLTLTSLTFVIYYAIDSATPYVLIVLWFTEIIPTQLLMLMLSPRRVIRGLQSEKTESRKSVPIFNDKE